MIGQPLQTPTIIIATAKSSNPNCSGSAFAQSEKLRPSIFLARLNFSARNDVIYKNDPGKLRNLVSDPFVEAPGNADPGDTIRAVQPAAAGLGNTRVSTAVSGSR